MNMFTQNEILLMIGVVSVLLICITILTILDIRDYLKAKKNGLEEDVSFGEEFKEKEEPATPKVIVEEKEISDEVLLNDIKTDDIFLEEMEDEEFDIPTVVVSSDEVSIPKVEVENAVVEEKPIKEKKRMPVFEEIESNLPNNKDDITNFEMEQERTAIISLDELLKKSSDLYDSNEYVQYDDGNEPITIDEVIAKFNKEEKIVDDINLVEKKVPQIVQDIVEEKIEPYSKKETVPFISSVYGIEKNNALEFENTATYEKLDRQNYNDFVAKLREMNENK